MKKPPDTTPHTLFSTGRVAAFAIAAPGLAPLVAAELTARGIATGDVSEAGVAFDADAGALLAVNLWSRVASRVLVRLASFTARDFATLEKQARGIDWRMCVAPGAAVRLRVTCRKSRLYHSDAVAERIARAIGERVRGAQVTTKAPDDDGDDAPDGPGASAAQLLVVRFDRDVCTISADSSGALLHRRGWRQAIAKAPLRETLAAAMLAASRWDATRALVDPFGGSGTIGIEAALLARNVAPGIARPFAMEQWPGVDAAMVRAQRDAARAGERPAAGVPIVISDRDAGACEAARSNAQRAGVQGDVTVVQRPLSDVDLRAVAECGAVLTNPPYGLRISDGADLRGLYARFGEVVRAGGTGWATGMLVPSRRYAAQAGLTTRTLFRGSNGGIPVTFEYQD